MNTHRLGGWLLGVVSVRLISVVTDTIADESLRSLGPQAVSTIKVSSDGSVITVGTMALEFIRKLVVHTQQSLISATDGTKK